MRVLLRRWVYFVLGGALFTPYGLLVGFVVPLMLPERWLAAQPTVTAVLLGGLLVGLIVGTGLIPFVRTIEGAAVPVLLGGPATGLPVTPARTAGARLRGVAWYAGHTVGGAVLSLATVAGLPLSVVLLVGAGTSSGDRIALGLEHWSVARAAAVPLGLVIPAVLVALVAGCGRLTAWLAPVLLGPDPVARIAELERRAAHLSEQNRLAQELHDSLGHALTVTALQAAAARRVMDDDPAFAQQALDAISRTSRAAAAELDDLLGVLRREPSARMPQPDLRGLALLVAGHRDAGLPLELELRGDLAAVPGAVSREVYRMLQEGLANAARHGGGAATSVRVVLQDSTLVAQVRNPLRSTPRRRARGGRGLVGLSERAALLGGRVVAGPAPDGQWLLDVCVPLGSAR